MRIIKGKKKLRACIQHNKISKRHICCASSCIVKAAEKNFIQLLLDSFSVCFLLLAKLERKKNNTAEKKTV